MNDRRLAVSLLAGITIATIGSELPVLARPQAAPMLVAQVACVVTKRTAVYTTANPGNPQVQGRVLANGTAVALTEPLPSVPPTRVQIKPNGFVAYAALDCGRPPMPPIDPVVTPPPKTSLCRMVRNTVPFWNVRLEPNQEAKVLALVKAGQRVYVTQTGAAITSYKNANGEVWVEVDLQRTLNPTFPIVSDVGWLSNSVPNDPRTTLVNGCDS
ncbi:MAG: hypothetical protein RBJ76_15405 [Stenomitos frigidus ULC029]